MKIFTCMLLGFFFFTNSLAFAKAPGEDVVTSQLVDKEDAKAPYQITGESLVGLLKNMVDFKMEGSSIVYHQKTGKLFVKNTPKNQKMVQQILEQLRNFDARQVMIEARIIEVSSFAGIDLGVDWSNINKSWGNGENSLGGDIKMPLGDFGREPLSSTNSLNLTYGYLNNADTLDITLRALEKDHKINTLSAPKIICFNNQRANIKIETSEDYISKITTETTYTNNNPHVSISTEVGTAVEGIILDVTPSINSDNKNITLELHPTVVELISLNEVSFKSGDSVKVPKYVKRSADTSVSLLDGGTIVIGGLMKRAEKKDVRKVPFLGDIPVIRNLFRAETKYEDKSNLMIFITAKIKDNV